MGDGSKAEVASVEWGVGDVKGSTMVGGAKNMASVLDDAGNTEEASVAGSTDKTEVASVVGDVNKEEGGAGNTEVAMVVGVTDDPEVASVLRDAGEGEGFMDKTEVAVVVTVTDETEADWHADVSGNLEGPGNWIPTTDPVTRENTLVFAAVFFI